ncbi:MAG: hypothetical protein RLZZ283_97 [Candidatus Parcubacteria bacterium]|jgi:hypothetical protein
MKDFEQPIRVQDEERKSILYHLIHTFGRAGADAIVKGKTPAVVPEDAPRKRVRRDTLQ